MKTITRLMALAVLLGTLGFAQTAQKPDDSKKADTTTTTTKTKTKTKKAKTKKSSKKKAETANSGDAEKK